VHAYHINRRRHPSYAYTVSYSAVLAFVSTTVDDFAVMLMFFGKATVDEELRANNGYLKVILGQTLGFSIVVFISLIGLLIGAIVPKEYIDLVGLFPFLVGVYKIYEVFQEEGCLCCCRSSPAANTEASKDATDGGALPYDSLAQAEDGDGDSESGSPSKVSGAVTLAVTLAVTVAVTVTCLVNVLLENAYIHGHI
jgi:hypothetical protein